MTQRPAGTYVAPHLIEAVRQTLAAHRSRHGWQPGMVWNPRTPPKGAYEWPGEGSSDEGTAHG